MSASTKRTRRNWFVDMSNPMRVLEDDARKTIICNIPTASSNKEAREDARLIAAAPELLDALDALQACAASVLLQAGDHIKNSLAIDLRYEIERARRLRAKCLHSDSKETK